MDKQKFDALTRAFATGSSRRTAIKGIFGGAVGVAVATTRLDRGGAQAPPQCTPETVGTACPLPDACTSATCQEGECIYSGGCEDCNVCDTLSGTCVDQCGDCDYCDGGQCVSYCGSCESCIDSECVSSCTDCQLCVEGEGICADRSSGICCGGTWVEGGQCCDAYDCVEPVADFCSSVACLDNICTNVPECPDDQQCCGLGSEGAYCAYCCDDNDCSARPCSTCVQGSCTQPECCYDYECLDPCHVCYDGIACGPIECPDGYTCCGDHECIPEDECCKGPGDFCGLLEVTGADGSPQNDCCDGLVCCDNWGDMGPICAQCCNDWDCGKDGWCNRGWCEWPDEECEHDSDCPKGACCCKDGSCSGKCCDTPHPPKPPKPPKPHKPHEPYTPAPPASGGTVTTLPATGAGPNDERNSLLGVTALGAAAALLAAKKLRETPEA